MNANQRNLAMQMQNANRLPGVLKQQSNPQEFGAESFEDYYIYPFYVAAIAPGDTETAVVQIQANSAFVLQALAYMVDDAQGVQTEATRIVPLLTVKIEDSGSGRFFQKDPIPLPNIAGTAQLPFMLPRERLCMPASTITATFTNYDAAVTYDNVYLSMIGYQIYNYSSS